MNGLTLLDPWLLLLGVPFLLLAAWRRRHPRQPAVAFPSLATVPRVKTWRVRLLRWPGWLFALGVVCTLVALARPRQGEARSLVRREGIAISMVLDRSGSMDQEMPFEQRRLAKIEIVKRVFTRFVRGGEGLPGRQSDLVGLTTFARFPQESCPLVAQYEPLLTTVKNLRTVPPFITEQRVQTRKREEAAALNPLSATAIGDALHRAVLGLITAEDDVARARGSDAAEEGYRIRGKTIILLTDGENNAGREPLEAAKLAAENGIKVYPILLQSRDVVRETLFGRRVQHHLSDEEVERLMAEPRAIAEATGGKAFLADDGDALREVYREIDRLERVDVGAVEYTSHRELFGWPLLLGIGLVLCGSLLDETLLRRSP